MSGEDKVIQVRDRRVAHQFSIHNRVIDEWFPIVGSCGLALYALYVRMAGREDERSYPSVRMIRKHMRMGVSTISDHNKLLVWCGLIHVEQRTHNSSNEYYILDIPAVTPERLAAIRSAALDDEARKVEAWQKEARKLAGAGFAVEAKKLGAKEADKFVRTVLKRLDGWQPISTYWKGRRERPQVVRPEQLSLFEQGAGDPVGDQGVRQEDRGVRQGDRGVRQEDQNNPNITIQTNNPNITIQTPTTANSAKGVSLPEQADGGGGVGQREVVEAILAWMGFNGRLGRKDGNPSVELILAWALWVKLRGADESKNPPGVARSKWRLGVFPEVAISSYARDALGGVLQLEPDGVGAYLDELVVGFGRKSFEDQVPAAYRDIVKR